MYHTRSMKSSDTFPQWGVSRCSQAVRAASDRHGEKYELHRNSCSYARNTTVWFGYASSALHPRRPCPSTELRPRMVLFVLHAGIGTLAPVPSATLNCAVRAVGRKTPTMDAAKHARNPWHIAALVTNKNSLRLNATDCIAVHSSIDFRVPVLL